jgi:hypothetical protein
MNKQILIFGILWSLALSANCCGGDSVHGVPAVTERQPKNKAMLLQGFSTARQAALVAH